MHKCTALRIVSYPIIPSYLCNIFSQYYESVSEARPDGSSAASLLRQTGKRTPERQSEPCTQKPSPTDRSNRHSEVGLYRSPLCIQDRRFPYGRHPRIHRPPFSPTDPLFYDTALLPHRSNGSGVSEPLCSRSSDKKDTTPGRMKVCANIPVGGRVYKIIIRIDPKKARKIDRTGRTAMRRSGACRSARSAGATRSTYSSP